MDKNIANAMLMRLNKQDQVAALQSIGFTTVNENTPASDIAKYMQWAGTLLDLSLATLRIEDGEQVFFTASEWNSMSANNRSKYIRIGIRSLMSVYFCGGSCIEDVTTHLMYHLSLHPTLRTCSADTILRAIKELTQDTFPTHPTLARPTTSTRQTS